MMSRQNYRDLAKALRESKPVGRVSVHRVRQWMEDVEAVAAVCKADNERFKTGVFLSACGYGEGDL